MDRPVFFTFSRLVGLSVGAIVHVVPTPKNRIPYEGLVLEALDRVAKICPSSPCRGRRSRIENRSGLGHGVPKMSRSKLTSVMRRIGRPLRPAFSAVVWLVVVALVSLGAMPVSGDSASLKASGTLVMICTKDGVQQISVDVDGNPVPSKADPCKAPCPFCLAHSGFALVTPSVEPPAPPKLTDLPTPALFPAVFVPVPFFLVGRHGRAPPPIA